MLFVGSIFICCLVRFIGRIYCLYILILNSIIQAINFLKLYFTIKKAGYINNLGDYLGLLTRSLTIFSIYNYFSTWHYGNVINIFYKTCIYDACILLYEHIVIYKIIYKGGEYMDKIFKALGDVNRLRIISLLLNTKLCVCELEMILDLTQSNVSRHLGRLRNVGLVKSTKEAQWVFYQFNSDFTKENYLLTEFLKRNFKSGVLYHNDWKRYLKYKESDFNCQNITDDKESVIKVIYSK